MSEAAPVPLAEQRRRVREALGAQRRHLALRLEPPPSRDSAYPRSRTMRWLMREPALVATLVGRIAGPRAAAAVPAALLLIRFLHSVDR